MSQSFLALRRLALLTWLTIGPAMQEARAAEAPVFAQAVAEQAAYGERAETLDRLIADSIRAERTGVFLAQLEGLASDAQLHPIARERLVHDAIMLSSQALPPAEIRSFVDARSNRAPAVYVWLLEGRHKAAVPLYDVGAAARFALRRWDELAARNAAALDLEQGLTGYLARWATDNAGRQGIVEALDQAETRELLSQRDAIATALRSDASVDQLALIVARRLSDKALFEDLAALARPAFAVHMLADVRASLAPEDAFEALRLASARPAIASAALLQMGHLASDHPAVAQFLLRSLANEVTGGSAAAALGRLHDPAIAGELGSILTSARPHATQRRAALALKLDGSAAADAELHKYVANPESNGTLRLEVAKWLAD